MKRRKRDVLPSLKDFDNRFAFFKNHPWILYPLFTLLGLFFIGGLLILILSRDLPPLEELEKAGDPFMVTRLYSRDGIVLKELFMQKRIVVPLDRMPDHLIQATIASEDRRFWDHWGLDIRRIFKLAFVNITSMSIRGGASTITQQLARKLYLTPRKTIIRKLREQLTSLQIERTYSKPEILEMYLNQMPLGRGTHGVQAAAQAYFQKNVEDLSVRESALIIGLLQLPYGYYSPDRDTTAALKRRNVILQSMVACDFLAPAEYDSLSLLELGVVDRDSEGKTTAPYFCEYVTRQLEKKYGRRLWTDGMTIQTTLDTRVQACADSALKAFLPELENQIRERIIKEQEFTQWVDSLETEEQIEAFLADSALVDSLLTEKATVQASLVAIDPTSGHILAMIGGRDFEKWKYNRAVQAKRQPGSAFKPIVYTVAIDNGWPPTTELLNQPVVLIMPDGTRWNPPNYDGTTGGPTTLREGLRRSLNLVTVRLVQEKIPKEQVVRYAKQFGLTTPIHAYDAVALGTDVVIPLELTSAFGVFTNRGVWVEPTAVLEVRNKDDNLLEEAIPRQREVISEQTAYIMTDLLSDVLNAPRGTGHAVRWKYNFYRPAAGKTGTTNDFRNAWFIGFTPQICAGVWVGFDDERISLGEDQSGAKTGLPIWAPFMRMAHDTLRLPLADFAQPPGIFRLKICGETKKIATESCPDIWDEVFTEQTAPTDTCEVHTDPWKHRKPRKKRERVIF
jgi:penicillin-binding protein 1A